MTRLAAILVLCLAGCASRPVAPELPPLPPGLSDAPTGKITPRAAVGLPWPQLTAAWNYSGTCDGFRLYHGTTLSRAQWTVLVDNIPPTARTVQFPSQERGFIGLKAFNSAGESGWSE